MRENVFLRDTTLSSIAASDGRRLEIVATGLPLHRGVPLGCDASLVSPLHTDGSPWSDADWRPGVAIQRAEEDKDTTYPELVDSDQLRLVTLACETGGRWSKQCLDTIRALAHAKAREAPHRLRRAAALAWERRWTAMLSVTVQSALASTLVDDAPRLLDAADEEAPPVVDLVQ